MYTPERHLLTPGQRGHSSQRHIAAGTVAPATTDTGNTVTQCANPHPHCSPEPNATAASMIPTKVNPIGLTRK